MCALSRYAAAITAVVISLSGAASAAPDGWLTTKAAAVDGVRLTGTVPSQSDRLQALRLARATTGVRSGVDQLQVAVN